jgi:hypothetical protein
MEHKPLAGIGLVADVHSAPLQPAMTPNQRLARWAEVLEREPTRELKSLEEIEGRSKAERCATRSEARLWQLLSKTPCSGPKV